MKTFTKCLMLLVCLGFLLACASKPAPGPTGPTEREKAEARERELRKELPG